MHLFSPGIRRLLVECFHNALNVSIEMSSDMITFPLDSKRFWKIKTKVPCFLIAFSFENEISVWGFLLTKYYIDSLKSKTSEWLYYFSKLVVKSDRKGARMEQNSEAVKRHVFTAEKLLCLTNTVIEKDCPSAAAEARVNFQIFPGDFNVWLSPSAEASLLLKRILWVLLVPS